MALLLSFAKEVAEQFVHLLSHASKTAEPLGLTALSRVEMQLAKHFDSRDLPSLGLGSFLDILDHNTQAFKPAAATVSDYDVTNGSEEEESGSVESEAKSDSESEDEETSDSSGDEDCQKFALAPSTYEVEEKTDEVEGNIDEAEEKKDEVLEEVASGIVADVDGAAASEGEGTAETTNADGDVGEGEEANGGGSVQSHRGGHPAECRRREFGIGIKLSKDAAQLMEVQQSICPRSSPAKTRTLSRSS
ncbi:unnamed protein product [Lampetra planeri]